MLQTDATYGMTPLHLLMMNPHAPAETIAALLDTNMEAVLCLDNQQKTPLEYARDYNAGGLVSRYDYGPLQSHKFGGSC